MISDAEKAQAKVLAGAIVDGLKTHQRSGVEPKCIYLGQIEWRLLRESTSEYIQYAFTLDAARFCGIRVYVVQDETHFNITGDREWTTM